MSNSNTRLITEIAFAAALGLLLNMIPHTFMAWITIELGVVPILLLAIRRGAAAGFVAGFVWGLLTIILGQASILAWNQALLEYIAAPIILGLAGFVKVRRPLPLAGMIMLAVVVKYLCHFWAGIIFWSQYAWKGWGAVAYSAIVNGVSGLLTAGFAVIIILIIVSKVPKILEIKYN